MAILFSNNASTQLVSVLTQDSTLLTVESVSNFPNILENSNNYFILTIDDGTNYEIVKCTARNTENNTFTVIRAQEGTEASLFNIGAQVELRITSGSISSIIEDASSTKPHASDTGAYGTATGLKFSHAKLTDNFELDAYAKDGIICSPFAVHQAVDRIRNALTKVTITSSQNWTVPETGSYTVTCVGGGGNGGTGGNYTRNSINEYDGDSYTCYYRFAGGGGGGGGGAAQEITQTLSLTKDQQIPITIGAAGGGTTSFGTHITALGGGNGGNGGNARTSSSSGTVATAGSGGAAGISYNGTATAGGKGQISSIIERSYQCHNWYSAGYVFIQGGAGGVGSNSINGVYGNGGNGGHGGGYWQEPAEDWLSPNRGKTNPTSGTQGVVYIQGSRSSS